MIRDMKNDEIKRKLDKNLQLPNGKCFKFVRNEPEMMKINENRRE